MEKKKSKFKFVKMVLGVIFFIVVMVIGIYRYPNQNITLVIKTASEKYLYELSANEVALFASEESGDVKDGEITVYSLNLSGVSKEDITKFYYLRKFKTVSVGEVSLDQLDNYVIFEDENITLNQRACAMIKKLSKSYTLERVFYAEIAFAIFIFLWIGIGMIEEKFDPSNKSNHGPIFELKRFFRELIKYREYIFYAAKADLKAEVANSYLNRLWWVLEPFFNMLVYVIVFGSIMGSSIENYATFVFSALLMWNYFSHIINYSVKCIRNNRDIVTKIYMPKYVLLLTNMVLNFIKFLFSLCVLIVLLFIFRVHIGIGILWVIPSYLLMLVLCFGIGMIFLHYGVFIDDLAYAVGILLNMLMFLSGVFYNVITTLESPLNVIVLCMNPVAMFIDTMRNALLYNTVTNVPIVAVWFVLGFLIFYIGLHTIYKNENGYVKVI